MTALPPDRPDDPTADDPASRLVLHRRRFLGLLAAGGAATVLGACSSGGDSDDGASGGSSARATSTTGGGASSPVIVPDPPEATGIDASPFALGVASGDPLPSSVVLWTRLVVDPLGEGDEMGDDDRAVLWEIASDDAFEHVVAADLEPAPAELGHSVHVDVDGLAPATSYWYRFRIGDFTSPVGRTRTAPPDDAEVDELRIAFASCQLRTAGHWTAYPHLVEDDPDLVLFLGDYIYEYPGGEGDLAVPLDDEPRTLAEYRRVYAAYKRDVGIQAAHAMAPWVVTWDDHEVENNQAAAVPEKAEDLEGFPARRAAAYQAFWEHHPIRTEPPKGASLQVYRSLRWGSLAELFVLDGRQYRSDQVCGDVVPVDRTECPELDDEDHTMLGTEQEAWLSTGLGASTATWKVLAQQTVMKALVLGDLVLNVDQWDGYPAARRRLLETIRDQDVRDVVVLTGDIHAAGAADLRVPDASTTGPVVASELVTTSISSPGFAGIVGDLDLTPLGLAYVNFHDHGYARATITPTRWTTEFVVVDTIAQPTSPAKVDATIEVRAGTPGVTRI